MDDFNNLILTWVVGFSSVFQLIRLLGAKRPRPWGWIFVSAALCVLLAVLLFVDPAHVGYISGAAWFVFLLLPMFLYRRGQNLARIRQFGKSQRILKLAAFFHPFDGWLEQLDLLRALDLGQKGKTEEARKILTDLLTHTQLAIAAKAALFELEKDYSGFLDWWVEEKLARRTGARVSGSLVIFYIRALGETGQLERLAEALWDYQDEIGRVYPKFSREMCKALAFAFLGKTEALQKLFSSSLLNGLPEDTKKFWIATSEQASGKDQEAQPIFESLSKNAESIPLRELALRRLNSPVRRADSTVDPLLVQLLNAWMVDAEHELRFADKRDFASRKIPVTHLLIALNVAVFILEYYFGGTEDMETLVRLGAVYAPAIHSGEYWRLLTGTFLHFGWVHISMNMLGLYILGPFVEISMGWFRYLVTYLVSGIGSMTFVYFFGLHGRMEGEILVGASGAIMGLVGATAAILLLGWRQYRSQLAYQRFRGMIFIVVFQAIFDSLVPQVSFWGHLSGSAIGFLVALIIESLLQKRRPMETESDAQFSDA